MRFSFVAIAERLPGAIGPKLLPIARIADDTVSGQDDYAVSRRMALASYSVRVASAAIAYVSQVLLARFMGTFEYGIFAAVWVAAALFGSIAAIGFPTAVVRYVPQYRERGQQSLLRGVIAGSRVMAAAAATVLAASAAVVLWLLGDIVTSYYVLPLFLGAVTVPMVALAETQDGIARAFNWATIALWPTFIVRPLLILGFMLIAVLAGAEPTAVTALYSVIFAAWVATIGQLVWLQRRVANTVPAGPRTYETRAWLSLALPMLVVEGAFNLLINVDILLVGYYLQPDQVGVYFAASKTLALVHFVYYAVRASGAQRFAQYHASGDKERLRAFVNDTLHWTFWPSLAMVVIVLVLGKPLLWMFGPSFGSGYPLLAILSIGILARASIGPAETLLIMAGQQRACVFVSLATLAFAVGINVLLIPMWGLYGAAWASSLTLIVESIALGILAQARLGLGTWIVLAMFRRMRAGSA